MLPESVLEEVGRLDPAAIAEVTEDAWPEVRDADELHDALLTLVTLPEGIGRDAAPGGRATRADWHAHFRQLAAARRAARAQANGRSYWVAAERKRSFLAVFPEARLEAELPDVESSTPSRDDALLALVTGWMMHSGPTTASELGETLGLAAAEIDKALLRLEAAGTILRGSFRGAAPQSGTTGLERAAAQRGIEWCERRLLARIHRLTLGTLRKQIEPVTAAEFMRWLLRWQHVVPGTQLRGERGVLEALRQLQGFEVPANAWEPQVLARRVAEYEPKVLDQLCLTGAVGWGRLSPHPATLEDSANSRRRVVPTSVAPITFFVREEADWMLPQRPANEADNLRGLSHGARAVLSFLGQRGASFFADIVRGTEKLKAEVETALWELVAGGLVTADGFDNLRALIDPRRRAGQGGGRSTRPRHSTGRWSVLYAADGAGPGMERVRAVEATCRMLLARYGVVFRDLLAREEVVPAWRELLIAFRRLEDRGEVRGGRFVSGFLGEQFALPMAVESLRALRRQEPNGETVTLSTADPLNLVGILVPGERVPAISGRTVRLRDGAALVEASGGPQARAGD